jgi:DNA-binding response OmpR family regulator
VVADRPLRVLLVDDDAALIRMVRLSFISEGFEVVTATDGIHGLECLEAQLVDAVVLDLQMPRMDGRTFYRALRTRGYKMPVVILSAYGVEDARDELNAEAAVRKPFDPEVLVEEVRRLVRGSAEGTPAEGGAKV